MNEERKVEEILENMIPNHKMGIKILKDVQLENMFPTYQNLFEKIDVHRSKIEKFDIRKMCQMDYQYNLMYDTVFSIFGTRGSGKTSAIFTLKKLIKERYSQFGDYVFPIIMPEMIPDTCDTLSWILAILGETVTQLEKVISSNKALAQDKDFFQNCRFRKDNQLRQEYNEIRELYFSKGYDVRQEESFETAIGNNGIQIQYGYEFTRKLIMFWTTLKETIAKCMGNKENREPLIYFIFDDVDLTPDRVEEMLSMIVKYLSHPNIIVIVTADEDLFNSVVMDRMQKKIGYYRRERNLAIPLSFHYASKFDEYILHEEMTREQKMTRIANLYLGKVLPPSLRYYLNLFDTCAKRKNFIVMAEADSNGKYINVESFLRLQVNRLKNMQFIAESDEYNNFLYYSYEQNGKFTFVEEYLLFWGNTSRQLANECIIIEELVSQLINIGKEYSAIKDYEKAKKAIYQQIFHFLYNTIRIDGQTTLSNEEINDLVRNVWYLDYEGWPLFFRYEYLNEYAKEHYEEDEPYGSGETEGATKKINDLLTKIFALLFFTENLLVIWDSSTNNTEDKQRKKVHGYRELVVLVDRITKENNSIIRYDGKDNTNNISKVLYTFGWILEMPNLLYDFDINDYVCVERYLYKLDTRMRKENANTWKMWSRDNPKWFSTMVRMTYLMYNNLYLLDNRDIKKMMLTEGIDYIDEYVKKKQYELEKIIENYVMYQDKDIKSSIKEECLFNLLKYISDRRIYSQEELNRFNAVHGNWSLVRLEEKMFHMIEKGKNLSIGPQEKGLYYLNFLKRTGEFPKNFILNKESLASSLSNLLEYLETNLLDIAGSFSNYMITTDYKAFMDIIRFIDKEHMFSEIKVSDNLIGIEVVNDIKMYILNYNTSDIGRWYIDQRDLTENWVKIIDSLQIYVDEQNIWNAMRFIALWESIITLQKYYIGIYVKQKSRLRVQKPENENNSFSKWFYGKCEEYVFNNAEDRDTLLKILIKNQMEQAGRDYYRKNLRRSRGDE